MDLENNSPDILSKAIEYEIKRLEGEDDIGDNEDSRLYFQNADISNKTKEHGTKFFGKVGKDNGESRKVFDLENDKPDIFNKTEERCILPEEEDDDIVDEVDSREIFDLIRSIKDPEHPLTLEELHVLEENLITVDTNKNEVDIFYTPTIPHCSMATLIGLSIRVKLLRCLSSRFKVNIKVTPGTHNAEHSVNKQLADKERVAAAIENSHLIKVIDECIYA